MKTNPAQWECGHFGYALLKTLGTGSFGVVRLAIATPLARKRCYRLAEDAKMKGHDKVAIKILHKEALREKDIHFVRKALKREVNLLQQLDHPHVIYLYEYFETPDRKYLVLEHAQNDQLSVFIRRYRAGQGVGLPEAVVRRFTKQLVEGVKYVHKCGIVHRDLKDENILLDRMYNVKISDFGFATKVKKGRLRDGGPLQHLETYCGSMEYMAPEVLRAEPYNGVLTDIWSLGVVFYTMLAGGRPFKVPQDLDKAVRCELFLQKMEEPLEFSTHQSEGAKDLARIILQVNKRKRPSLKRISEHPWLREASTKYTRVLEHVVLHRESYRAMEIARCSRRDTENTQVETDDEEAESASDVDTSSLRGGSDLDVDPDLDGRRAPSPLHTTPEELSGDEHLQEAAAATANDIIDTKHRNVIVNTKPDEKAPEGPDNDEDQRCKTEAAADVKTEHPSRKLGRGARHDIKLIKKRLERLKGNGKDQKAEDVVSGKDFTRQRKRGEEADEKGRMASTTHKQQICANGNSTKTQARKRRIKRVEEYADTDREIPEELDCGGDKLPTDDHMTTTRKERSTTLKKKPKRLGDKSLARTKTNKKPSKIESIKDVYEYSDDFEEESDESESTSKDVVSCLESESYTAEVIEQQDENHLRRRSKKRYVKTAFAPKADMTSVKHTTRAQHLSAKARATQGERNDHASANTPCCYKRGDSLSPDSLSPPPEELTPVGDGNVEDSSGTASPCDQEEEEVLHAVVPWGVGRGKGGKRVVGSGSTGRLSTVVPKNRNKGAHMAETKEGHTSGRVGRRMTQKYDHGRRVDKKVKAGGFLPPIDVQWGARYSDKRPPIDANPAGDIGTRRLQRNLNAMRREKGTADVKLPVIVKDTLNAWL